MFLRLFMTEIILKRAVISRIDLFILNILSLTGISIAIKIKTRFLIKAQTALLSALTGVLAVILKLENPLIYNWLMTAQIQIQL